jgi:UDP-3-O-[3-hydroxymyristoyl] glucosamine N-acyltransferase
MTSLINTVSAINITLEDALQQPKSWWEDHQFFHASTNVVFRMFLADQCAKFNPYWVSLISEDTYVNSSIDIGKNVLVNHFNHLYGPAKIHDHAIITSYCNISHECEIRSFCYISPYSYLCFTDLGTACCLGARSSFMGMPDNRIQIADRTNFIANGVVTKSIANPGTYYGNRKVDDLTSYDKKIL